MRFWGWLWLLCVRGLYYLPSLVLTLLALALVAWVIWWLLTQFLLWGGL